MGKAEVDKVKAMNLAVGGCAQSVCLDCRDLLANMIRYRYRFGDSVN